VIGDETWAHNYDPENKTQSVESRYQELPAPKKIIGWKTC